MSLLYKPDWEEARERYLAWWAHEAIDRAAIWVTAPKDRADKLPALKWPDDPIQRWTDLDFLVALSERGHAATFYGGEAVPLWTGGYPGHVCLSVFMGCPLKLDMHTGWRDHVLTDTEWSVEDLKIDRTNRWYQFGMELAKASVDASLGKSIPSTGAFGGCGDTLVALRGNERLLIDVMERPELVRQTESRIIDLWIDYYREVHDILLPATDGGSGGWFPLWAPGTFYATQCDLSCMISPEMFVDIFVPALEKQLDFLDYSVHHVDGVDAFRHVPALCDLPKLNALQIGPEAGRPGPLHYLDTLRYVQDHGKNLHISLQPEEVETALAELSARGLVIMTRCETETQARELLANATKWSHD